MFHHFGFHHAVEVNSLNLFPVTHIKECGEFSVHHFNSGEGVNSDIPEMGGTALLLEFLDALILAPDEEYDLVSVQMVVFDDGVELFAAGFAIFASGSHISNMESVQVVAIDEIQFFDEGIVDVCNTLANAGIRVIVSGLDMDYLGNPFGPMPKLMAVAEYVSKQHAICTHCGDLAQYSHRIVAGDGQVLLGEKEAYEPLCRHCFNEALKKEKR